MPVQEFLRETGYDSYVSLKSLTDDDLKNLEEATQLLPGHRAALIGYRDFVKSNDWGSLVQKASRMIQSADAFRAQDRKKLTKPKSGLKQTVSGTLSKEEAKRISEKFQERIFQWTKSEGLPEHTNVSQGNFEIETTVEGNTMKFGAWCPFCKPKKLVMLFYSQSASSIFQVTTSNYAKHYIRVHKNAVASRVAEKKKRQMCLNEMYPVCSESKSIERRKRSQDTLDQTSDIPSTSKGSIL